MLLSWNPGLSLYVAAMELNLDFLICWACPWADGGFPWMFESLLSWVVWNREFVMLSMEQNSRSGFSLLKTPGKLLSVCLSVKRGWRLCACSSLTNTNVKFKAHYLSSRLVSVWQFSGECLKGSKPNWYQENIYFWGMNNSFKSHFCISLSSLCFRVGFFRCCSFCFGVFWGVFWWVFFFVVCLVGFFVLFFLKMKQRKSKSNLSFWFRKHWGKGKETAQYKIFLVFP